MITFLIIYAFLNLTGGDDKKYMEVYKNTL